MLYDKTEIPLTTPVNSLCWSGDVLIDWSESNRAFTLDGKTIDPNTIWSYRFDAVAQSPSRRFTVVYERLGTKALVLDNGRIVRELNRSFYHAQIYEYPIVLFRHPDGRELIAHCPDEYNRLEIEIAADGTRLTASANRLPCDFFHSRLAVSLDQSHLISAGWIWHPFSTVLAWPIAETLQNPAILDSYRTPYTVCSAELNAAAFIDDHRLLLNSTPEADDLDKKKASTIKPGCLGIFNLLSGRFEHIVKVEEPVGNMLWLGDNRAVGFHQNPRLFDIATGKILMRWPDLQTGTQDGSIISHISPLPPLALDPQHRRFAVASNDRITVIRFT